LPKRTDIKNILVIGSGPIVIGQACEFDYSGTQACRALVSEGYRVILLNSNPATIMTDPETAQRTYIEPISVEVLEKIIAAEKPDALLPTLGGQTALNTAVAAHEAGVLEKYGVEMIGADYTAIHRAEDRDEFKKAMARAGAEVPRGKAVYSVEEAERFAGETGLPLVIRPAFTMGGTGGGFAFNIDEFREAVRCGLEASPIGEVLVEESVLGWKEYELEVMRDRADNVVIVCSIENLDPMGVHTGEGHRHNTRDRRGDRGLQHPVRGASRNRPAGGHRDEPAGLALQRPGQQGHRLPHRQVRRQAGRGLHAGGDPQRHHP